MKSVWFLLRLSVILNFLFIVKVCINFAHQKSYDNNRSGFFSIIRPAGDNRKKNTDQREIRRSIDTTNGGQRYVDHDEVRSYSEQPPSGLLHDVFTTDTLSESQNGFQDEVMSYPKLKPTELMHIVNTTNKPLNVLNRCLISIQKNIIDIYSDILGDVRQEVILIDPAYHQNVGDNLISYGEMLLLEKVHPKFSQCGVMESYAYNKPCQLLKKQRNNYIGVWQGGGNWGDLWNVQNKRFASFSELLRLNMTVVGMPQSLFYNQKSKEIEDAHSLNTMIKRWKTQNSRVILSWRQPDSYYKARELYPMIEHRLVPDIAFMIGLIKRLKQRKHDNVKDLLFLLRKDKESVVVRQNVKEKIASIIDTLMLKKPLRQKVSFEVVDWDDCYLPQTYQKVHVMQQLESDSLEGTSFDFNERFTRAAALISKGKVVITDRLHGSIFAFLSHKPHVYIDQMYRKIELTRKVAFDSSSYCKDKYSLMYDKAESLTHAVELAVNMLYTYDL